MKEVQELDVYVHSGFLMQNYWVALSLVLVTAGGGIIAVLACWYRRCRQSMAKIQMKKTKRYRDENYTGHERYYQSESSGRRNIWRRKGIKESKSASEIATKAVGEAEGVSAPRSSSSDHVTEIYGSCGSVLSGNPVSKAPRKIESLARLFSCIAVAGESPTQAPRQTGTYAYTALEPDTNIHERMEMEKKARERANSVCSLYLRSNPRYTFVDQLNDIGSRVEKHWFIVRDNSVKTERLLALVPRGPTCPIQCNAEIRSVILDLFLALQHPYIYPVLDINFRDVGSKSYIFVTLPLNSKGSLKDFIYKSQWQEDWGRKYSQRSTGLPISQVQRLGRQILEALLFLRKKGFPPSGHIHSGNIILQNGVARLTGLENTLLGYTSRTQPVLWSRAQCEPSAVDSLCFGHVLFEMCAGYELDMPKPTPGNLLDLHQYPQVVEVLDFIFENPEMRLPTIEELLLCDLFRNIDLREIRNQAQSTQVFKTQVTPKGVELLNELKKFQNGQLRKLKAQTLSLPYFDAESPLSSQQEKSTSSGGSEQEMDDDAYDADANSDPDTLPIREHRCLSLHNSSVSRIMNYQPSDLR